MAEIKQTLPEVDGSEYDKFLADLRGMVWNNVGGETWQSLAGRAGLSQATVSKFASGDTRRPQQRTVLLLAKALGYRLALVPADTPKLPGEFRV